MDQAFAMLAHTEFYDDTVPLTDAVVDQVCCLESDKTIFQPAK